LALLLASSLTKKPPRYFTLQQFVKSRLLDPFALMRAQPPKRFLPLLQRRDLQVDPAGTDFVSHNPVWSKYSADFQSLAIS
jgi:hypothetical protein